MSLYSEYLEETKARKIFECNYGFITWHISGQECYCVDLYVKPDKRDGKLARDLLSVVEEDAKKNNCKYLLGTVNTNIKDSTKRLKMHLVMKFKLLRSEPGLIWFVKELCQGPQHL